MKLGTSTNVISDKESKVFLVALWIKDWIIMESYTNASMCYDYYVIVSVNSVECDVSVVAL